MFSLLRLVFWLGIVLLLLPISTSEDGTRQIGAWQALTAAQSALADASGFCQRQPEACAVGGQLLSHLGDKAQAAAGWLLESVGNSQTPAEPSAPAGPQPASHALTPQDLAPVWGGENAEGQKSNPALVPASVPLPPRRPA